MGQYDRLGEMLSDALKNGFECYKPRTHSSEKKHSAKQDLESGGQNAFFKEKQAVHDSEDKKSAVSGNSKVFTDKPSLDVLGLKAPATEESIKEAYRTLLKKYHPDSVPDFPEMQKTAARRTREIVEAYKKLIKNKE